MKTGRIFALLIVASAFLAGTAGAVSFANEGMLQIANPYDIISSPTADGDCILWIETIPLSFSNPGDFPGVPCAVYSYNVTSRTKILIRSHVTNACSPDLDGYLAVWEEVRGSTTDIILYNFTSETVSALQMSGFQHNPRVSVGRIVWEEGLEDDRNIWMYDLEKGSHSGLAVSKSDSFSPDIEGNTVVWVEKSEQDVYSIVSLDLVSGRKTVLDTTSSPVCPRIDGGKVVWEDGGFMFLSEDEEGISILSDEPARRSGVTISGTVVAWSEEGRILCLDLSEMQTTRIGKQDTSMKPAIMEGGLAWVVDNHCELPSIRYQPFSSTPKAGLQVIPSAAVMTPTRGKQNYQLQEGECLWYGLEVSPGTNQLSLDISWKDVNESLSCTLIGPVGTVFRFTDSDDGEMDARVRLSVTSPAGIVPGRWYCVISGESIQEEVEYSIIWYESGVS